MSEDEDDDISVSDVVITPICRNLEAFRAILQAFQQARKERGTPQSSATSNLQYEDPKIDKLKANENVRQLYYVAEEIVTGEDIQLADDEEETVEEEEGDNGAN